MEQDRFAFVVVEDNSRLPGHRHGHRRRLLPPGLPGGCPRARPGSRRRLRPGEEGGDEGAGGMSLRMPAKSLFRSAGQCVAYQCLGAWV